MTNYPVGTSPLDSYRPPIFSLGSHKSANGIIEYTAHAFCDDLRGDLLVAYYSSDDQIRRLTLGTGGLTVIADATLTKTTANTGGVKMNNPLSLVGDPLGRLYVTEFGGNKVRIFDPIGPGCWQTDDVASLPTPLVDAAGAVVGGHLHVIGGKSSAGHQKAHHIYNPTTNA